MARNTSISVFLGFEDEAVTENNKNTIDYRTNRVGGDPVWPNSEITISPCPLCGLRRILLLQLYAPLPRSQFHRIFYIFSCLNAYCSNQSRSWTAIRVETVNNEKECPPTKVATAHLPNINWYSGSDNWDNEDYGRNEDIENDNLMNEANGNFVINDINRMSDEDEESNSFENDVLPYLGNLQIDDKNANCGAQGICDEPIASAEIENDETELVLLDSPVMPQRDLIALFKQTSAVTKDIDRLSLKSFFIYVDEEDDGEEDPQTNSQYSTYASDHVRQLIQDYHRNDEKSKNSPTSPQCLATVDMSGDHEQYEKGIPIHGDIMFHNFLTIIQKNPSQIIRYSRDALPILIAPIVDAIPRCQYCRSEMICEIQILPTIITKLRLANGDSVPIEFGNVLIYTCIASCWDTPDKMRLEYVIVQQEK